MTERAATFECFGATCGVWVTGDGPRGDAGEAVAAARRSLLGWHGRFTRFSPDSELSRLNHEPGRAVELSPIMGCFVRAALNAAQASGGLVDPTQLHAIESAGYRSDLRAPLPLELALRLAPPRRPASPHPLAAWRRFRLEANGRHLVRPPGVGLDSGGIVKGLLADLVAKALAPYEAFAVNCAGDLRVGGTPREVRISSPFDGRTIHRLELSDCGVATSGIGRRSWLHEGRPMHHLLDPATGEPAFTGIVQATAVAPSALEAEWRAKAAVLSGPAGARERLPHGGVLVYEDGSRELVADRQLAVAA